MPENEDLNKQLETIQNQLNHIRKEMLETKVEIWKATESVIKCQIPILKDSTIQGKISTMWKKLSDFDLYWSIYISALVGVMGNWFVTLWFQPPIDVGGLILSGSIIVGTFIFLLIQMTRSIRQFNESTKLLQQPNNA
jgi:hypothetical protein